MSKFLRSTTLLCILGLSPGLLIAQGDILNVFFMAGQSNMEGHAYAYEEVPWDVPTLQFLIDTPAYLAVLPDATYTFKDSFNANWTNPRDDVWAVQFDSIGGPMLRVEPTPAADQGAWATAIMPLSPGFGSSNSYSSFGPELGMGTYLGEMMGAPLLLVKSDHGGRTLAINFRPPSAGGTTGGDYLSMVGSYQAILDGLDADLADDGLLNAYDNAIGYHVAAFVWLQGWNEMGNAGYVAEYEDNLVDLIHDLRASDPRIPGDLPMIIPESADQHEGLNTARIAAVATLNAEIPGSAVFIENNDMIGKTWPGYSHSHEWGYHFNARAENYLEIGWRIGVEALENGYVMDGPLNLSTPASTGTNFNQTGVSSNITDDADGVTVVWDTVDHGTEDTGDWPHTKNLGAWTGGAGQVSTVLTGLAENTSYVFRFYASSATLADEAWSSLGSFVTLYENPPPLMGIPGHTPPASDGTIASCEVLRAAADSCNLVWAHTDQGDRSVAMWTGAPGGGSVALGAANVGDVPSHTLTGLDPRTEYFYRFVATNIHGTDWSVAGSFTTAREGGLVELTAWYDFEGTGTDRFDDPAGNFADDLVGGQAGAVFSSDTPGAIAGTQSTTFDGSNTLFTDAYTTDLGPDPDSWTIMFWIKGEDNLQENNNTRLMTSRVKPDGTNTTLQFWQVEGFGNNGANGDKMDVRLNPGYGDLWFGDDAIDALARADQGEVSPTYPQWRHVAIVVSNSGWTDGGAYGETFVDGVSVGAHSEADVWDGKSVGNAEGQLIIGGEREGNPGRGFTGLLDDVALFAGVVEDADIAAIAAGTMSPADFLPAGGITITSVEVVGANLAVGFTGAANTDYKLTESADIAGGFDDTSPLVEETTDPDGNGTMIWPLSGANKFGRVETK